MKQSKVAEKTMAMKCRVTNLLRKELHDFCLSEDYNKSHRYKKTVMTDKQKIELVDKLYGEISKMNFELSLYKEKRQYRKKIEDRRKAKKDLEISK